MSVYTIVQEQLAKSPKRWLVTGCAGFIGSHLVEKLVDLGQEVVGLDNLSTGKRTNLSTVRRSVGPTAWKRFSFVQGDICDRKVVSQVCRGVDYVLHQAALGSVPRSIEEPLRTNDANVGGFLNVLVAAREVDVKHVVYASSSSIYGDEETLPKKEDKIGRPLSPYAVSKYVDELYAAVFSRCYGLRTTGLRYFNVFGPRQDPEGEYAAVIPKWIAAMQNRSPIYIYGDGQTSRDFCYVANVVQANLIAAIADSKAASNSVYNIACHERTTLNELFALLRENLLPTFPHLRRVKPRFKPFRSGDVRHSFADIRKARRILGYSPTHSFAEGLRETTLSVSRAESFTG